VNESRTNESYLRILYVCPILGIARDTCAAMLPSSRSVAGTHCITASTTLGASSFLLEARDIDAFHAIVLAKLESVHIGLTYHLDRHIIFVKEWMLGRSERRDRNS